MVQVRSLQVDIQNKKKVVPDSEWYVILELKDGCSNDWVGWHGWVELQVRFPLGRGAVWGLDTGVRSPGKSWSQWPPTIHPYSGQCENGRKMVHDAQEQCLRWQPQSGFTKVIPWGHVPLKFAFGGRCPVSSISRTLGGEGAMCLQSRPLASLMFKVSLQGLLPLKIDVLRYLRQVVYRFVGDRIIAISVLRPRMTPGGGVDQVSTPRKLGSYTFFHGTVGSITGRQHCPHNTVPQHDFPWADVELEGFSFATYSPNTQSQVSYLFRRRDMESHLECIRGVRPEQQRAIFSKKPRKVEQFEGVGMAYVCFFASRRASIANYWLKALRPSSGRKSNLTLCIGSVKWKSTFLQSWCRSAKKTNK